MILSDHGGILLSNFLQY